jgi:hypothetical protein
MKVNVRVSVDIYVFKRRELGSRSMFKGEVN